MANIKSAKKRVELSEIRRQRNAAVRSEMKTQLKSFSAAIASGDKESAQNSLNLTVKNIDKTAAKGVIHRNMAARKKSNLYKAFNNM